MRLIDRLLERYRAQGYYEGMASGASVLFTYGSDSKREGALANIVEAARQAYSTNGVVYACILARMMLLAEASFKFRTLQDKTLYGTEDLRILEYPWPGATAGELWARMEQDVSLAGNAFIAKIADDTLLRLPPGETTIVSQEVTSPTGIRYKQVIGYEWDPSQGQLGPDGRKIKAQSFTVDEVAHWSPYPDPAANFRGMSWMTPIMREVTADSGMIEYKTQYLDHGSPVTAVSYDKELRPDTIDSIVERIRARYGGVGNAWRTLVFDRGGKPVLGGGLKDLDYAAVQSVGESRICAAAGVPLVVVGLEAAQRSSEPLADGLRRLADITARPLWRSGCAALQKLVPNMPARGVQLWYDTTDVAALQAAETEKAQVTQVTAAAMLTLVQAGFTRESVILAGPSGDLSLLVPDPNAPIPGTVERLTEALHGAGSVPDPGTTAAPPGGTLGKPNGGGQVATKPQTGASKKPMPSSFKTSPTDKRSPALNGNH